MVFPWFPYGFPMVYPYPEIIHRYLLDDPKIHRSSHGLVEDHAGLRHALANPGGPTARLQHLGGEVAEDMFVTIIKDIHPTCMYIIYYIDIYI